MKRPLTCLLLLLTLMLAGCGYTADQMLSAAVCPIDRGFFFCVYPPGQNPWTDNQQPVELSSGSSTAPAEDRGSAFIYNAPHQAYVMPYGNGYSATWR